MIEDRRGNFTEKSTAIFKSFFGHEPAGKEVRLFVYLQYVMVNSQTLDGQKITDDEMTLIQEYLQKGYLYFSKYGKKGLLRCTPEFWEMMAGVTYYAFVLRGNDNDIK